MPGKATTSCERRPTPLFHGATCMIAEQLLQPAKPRCSASPVADAKIEMPETAVVCPAPEAGAEQTTAVSLLPSSKQREAFLFLWGAVLDGPAEDAAEPGRKKPPAADDESVPRDPAGSEVEEVALLEPPARSASAAALDREFLKMESGCRGSNLGGRCEGRAGRRPEALGGGDLGKKISLEKRPSMAMPGPSRHSHGWTFFQRILRVHVQSEGVVTASDEEAIKAAFERAKKAGDNDPIMNILGLDSRKHTTQAPPTGLAPIIPHSQTEIPSLPNNHSITKVRDSFHSSPIQNNKRCFGPTCFRRSLCGR